MLPNVHSSTIYNSQDMETTWMSTDIGMDEEDVVHIYQWSPTILAAGDDFMEDNFP